MGAAASASGGMADTHGLGPCAFGCESSNLSLRISILGVNGSMLGCNPTGGGSNPSGYI